MFSAVPLFSFCSCSAVSAFSVCSFFPCAVVFLHCISVSCVFVSFSSSVLSLSCIISFASNFFCSVATSTGNLFCWLFCVMLSSLFSLNFLTFALYLVFLLVQLSWCSPSVFFVFVSFSV